MVNKSVWGRLSWFVFHGLAHKLKLEYQYLAPLLFAHIKALCVHLPCPDCARHAQLMWANYPFMVGGKEDLVRALWRAHNVVNIRLGKPVLSRNDHDQLYTAIPLFKVCNDYKQVMTATEGSDLRLTDSFHRKRTIDNFLNFVKQHWHCFER